MDKSFGEVSKPSGGGPARLVPRTEQCHRPSGCLEIHDQYCGLQEIDMTFSAAILDNTFHNFIVLYVIGPWSFEWGFSMAHARLFTIYDESVVNEAVWRDRRNRIM
jgi:hypothetical protein